MDDSDNTSLIPESDDSDNDDNLPEAYKHI